MIACAREEHPELDLQLIGQPLFYFADESFGAVVLFTTLTCIPDAGVQDRLMGEVHRILRRGGVLYLSDLELQDDERNQARYAEGEARFGVRGVFELLECATLVHHPPERLKELLSGFEPVDERRIPVTTMNGHPVHAVQVLARKTE